MQHPEPAPRAPLLSRSLEMLGLWRKGRQRAAGRAKRACFSILGLGGFCVCCGKAELLLGCLHLQTYIAACIELSKLWRCAGWFKETRKGLAIVEVSVQERIVFGGGGGSNFPVHNSWTCCGVVSDLYFTFYIAAGMNKTGWR